jgi:hypothetical protein
MKVNFLNITKTTMLNLIACIIYCLKKVYQLSTAIIILFTKSPKNSEAQNRIYSAS